MLSLAKIHDWETSLFQWFNVKRRYPSALNMELRLFWNKQWIYVVFINITRSLCDVATRACVNTESQTI